MSSGDVVRHRLSRAGDRQLNHALHIMAITQLARDTDGRAYYQRKRAAGKSRKEALRCLKRRLSDVVYRQLLADAATSSSKVTTNPGGQSGDRRSTPARPADTPAPALRISHNPGSPKPRYNHDEDQLYQSGAVRSTVPLRAPVRRHGSEERCCLFSLNAPVGTWHRARNPAINRSVYLC